jgi:hypothetical protein
VLDYYSIKRKDAASYREFSDEADQPDVEGNSVAKPQDFNTHAYKS